MSERYARIRAYLDENREVLIALSRAIWERPELGFQEHFAAGRLTEALEQAGFEVERGVAGMETAFRATWRGQNAGPDGKPVIAILCEYDALPGLGHACGHNLIAVAGLAAGLALREAWPDMPGTVQVIGTPAEEGGGGKVVMVQAGVFNGVDAAMMFHPSARRSIVHRSALACQELTIRFYGKPAHAAAAPWKGVNALDAMIQFFVNVALLRQQVRDGCRLHGVITHGGDAPNVIPERTEARFLVRAPSTEEVLQLRERVLACARAGAEATGCRLEYETDLIYAHRVNNMTMARTFQRHLEACGFPVSEPEPGGGVGSSDIGNVSLVCPTIHPYVAITDADVSGHTQEFREASNSEGGYRAMLAAAYAMAATAADLLADPELLARAKEEFRREVGEPRVVA